MTSLRALAILGCWVMIDVARAQDPAPGQPARPGVRVTFATPDGAHTDTRIDRLIALHVPQGQSPAILLPPGPFTATWSGQLNVDLRDRFQFSFEGNGSFELTINGEAVLSFSERDADRKPSGRIRLGKGPNTFTAKYSSPQGGGPATARLLWRGSDFPLEPIPPTTLTHTPEANIDLGTQLRRARELFATGRCFFCHAPDATFAPDLLRDAPALILVGNRLNPGWLARWVARPHSLRPDAQMPALLRGETSAQDARDIAAFLMTMNAAIQPALIPDDAATKHRGAQLYGSLGCVACHGGLHDEDEPLAATQARLSQVGLKYQPHALRDYLLHPHGLYAWTRMPDFKLAEDEATALAAYLLDGRPNEAQTPAGDAARGRDLVETVGCLNCHPLPLQNRYVSPAFAELRRSGWSGGCVAGDATNRGRAPDFAFTDDDLAAIRTLAKGHFGALTRTVPAEFAMQQMKSLRCDACHAVDGEPDVWSSLLRGAGVPEPAPGTPEVGASTEPPIDQSRPPLTFAGEKLQPVYTERLIAGELGYETRPWLHARMPAFPAYAPLLAEGLAAMHGIPPQDPWPGHADGQLAAVGAKLVAKAQGFGCTDCHAIGDQPAQNVFEAQGVSLSLSPKRLRQDYYMRWMLHPLRIDPSTKMPRYADEHGKTQLSDTLGGNAKQQFEAIWQHLQALPR